MTGAALPTYRQLKEPFCTVMPDTGTLPAGSDCGSVLALAYYPWFYIVVVFVFINLFVSLILENFSSSYVPPEENQGSVDGASRHCVTMADFDSYQSVWAKYDPKGSGTFPIHKLRSFLNVRHPDAAAARCPGTPAARTQP